MNSQATKKSTSNSGGHATNPFARALAETEKSAFENADFFDQDSKSFDSDSGSDVDSARDFANTDFNDNQDWMEQQKIEAKEQAKKDALRKKLHDQVNPVDNQDVFNAREKQVKQEIDQIRHELKLLAQELSEFHQEIDLTLMSNPAKPGTTGKYYINFFQQLRTWIALLRQKVHSARTWANQTQNKKKKSKKHGGNLVFEGKSGHETGKTIFDMMHHEVSNARSGG